MCGPDRTRSALTDNLPISVSIENFCGAFRMVSLRDVVSFYATRNSNPTRWYGPAGVPNDVPLAYRANVVSDRVPLNQPASAGPALSEREIDDVVAFLRTLGDAPMPAAPNSRPAQAVGVNPFGR